MNAKSNPIRVAPAPDCGPAGREDAATIARRVLDLEAEGIVLLARALERDPGPFTRAIEILEGVRGRVVVSGMGKSGHVARKIAATLASTGTPSQFVHPAEASHGDLGMITRADAVLALSQSGETAEMTDLLAFCRRFGIPVIGITGGAASSLAQAADVTLLLPPIKEACPLGLAPTTSTTAMLALGDAVAVALFERQGFSADDFHQFHPRGALGKRFLRVSDVMHRGEQMPLITSGAPMSEALVEMTAKRLGCVGVVDAGGRLLGIVTDGDLRRHMSPDLLQQRVDTIMSANPKTIRPGALAVEALGVMNAGKGNSGITTLFVVDPGSSPAAPVGILHIHDLLRAGIA